MCGKNNGRGIALRQNFMDRLNTGQTGNIDHLSATGKNAPKEDHCCQRILMENGNALSWADAELLQTCCNLPALQVQCAKADALVGKNQSRFFGTALCRFGKQIDQWHKSRPCRQGSASSLRHTTPHKLFYIAEGGKIFRCQFFILNSDVVRTFQPEDQLQ